MVEEGHVSCQEHVVTTTPQPTIIGTVVNDSNSPSLSSGDGLTQEMVIEARGQEEGVILGVPVTECEVRGRRGNVSLLVCASTTLGCLAVLVIAAVVLVPLIRRLAESAKEWKCDMWTSPNPRDDHRDDHRGDPRDDHRDDHRGDHRDDHRDVHRDDHRGCDCDYRHNRNRECNRDEDPKCRRRVCDAWWMLATMCVAVYYSATPSPGKNVFSLLVGYIYGWWGFLFLIIGHACGSVVAFLSARHLWQNYLEELFVNTALCSWCTKRRPGRLPRAILLIQGSIAIVEERPLQTIFLLGLSPAPLVITAYMLGARARALTLCQFAAPFSCSGIKFVFPIYLAVKIGDLEKLLADGWPDDPVDLFPTILSICIGILVTVVIGRLSWRRLQKLEQQAAHDTNPLPAL